VVFVFRVIFVLLKKVYGYFCLFVGLRGSLTFFGSLKGY
jgi:hypothetical protein